MHPSDLPPELTDRKFELAVRRLADDLRYGHDASPYVGSGVDYVQSRPFVEGDPVKDIDWRVTARTRRWHVKEYESLKSVPVYIVLDTSASMSVSSRPVSKYLVAALLAGGIGLAAQRRLSPVGLLGAGGRSLHFRPSLAQDRIFQWLLALAERRFDEPTTLGRRLDELAGLLKSRCLVVVLSDLHDPDATDAIKRLAQRHDMVVLQLEDPAERGRLRGGFVQAVEAETGREFAAHGRSRWLGDGKDAPDQSLRRAGIDYLRIATDRPFLTPLRRLLTERGGLFRAAR